MSRANAIAAALLSVLVLLGSGCSAATANHSPGLDSYLSETHVQNPPTSLESGTVSAESNANSFTFWQNTNPTGEIFGLPLWQNTNPEGKIFGLPLWTSANEVEVQEAQTTSWEPTRVEYQTETTNGGLTGLLKGTFKLVGKIALIPLYVIAELGKTAAGRDALGKLIAYGITGNKRVFSTPSYPTYSNSYSDSLQGCCSYHEGISKDYSGNTQCHNSGMVLCNDLQPSPTCICPLY